MQKYFNDIIKEIQKTISYNSALSAPKENAPFGKETADCLCQFLSTAKEMGFETHNYDNYVGEVVYGEGEDFAILAHLDVVPAGNGWIYPPFHGEIHDNKIYGRGAMDDKGPAVVLLYALYALKQENFLPKRKIKLILGCNEESGWKCMEHYKKVCVMPREGFTPDADFPVIYAEKGIAHLQLSFPADNLPFFEIYGGEQANMVCDKAWVTLKENNLNLSLNKKDYAQEGNKIIAFGKSAHGSTPEKGKNAIKLLLQLFQDNKICNYAYDVLFNDVLNLTHMQDETGILTMSPDMIRSEKNCINFIVDFRYPATHSLHEITQCLDNNKIIWKCITHQLPLYNDPKSPLISKLLKVYNDITGKQEKPIAIGGGTYARALECGCGFGPESEEEECTIHQANEYISFEKIKMLSKIYYQALKEISK